MGNEVDIQEKHSIFRSEGDVEALILFENRCAFAGIINRELYTVCGTAPDQQISFDSNNLDLFCIRVSEFLSERPVKTSEKVVGSMSIFSGSKWLLGKYQGRVDLTKLNQSISALDSWLNVENDFKVWNGNTSKHVIFKLTRKKMLRFAGLISKHNLFNIKDMMADLFRISTSDAAPIELGDIFEIMDTFEEELKVTRINYLSTSLVELLHNYFTDLNEVVNCLYGTSGNQMAVSNCPPDLSDSFWHIHWVTITFARAYNRTHYNSLKPHTGLKGSTSFLLGRK